MALNGELTTNEIMDKTTDTPYSDEAKSLLRNIIESIDEIQSTQKKVSVDDILQCLTTKKNTSIDKKPLNYVVNFLIEGEILTLSRNSILIQSREIFNNERWINSNSLTQPILNDSELTNAFLRDLVTDLRSEIKSLRAEILSKETTINILNSDIKQLYEKQSIDNSTIIKSLNDDGFKNVKNRLNNRYRNNRNNHRKNGKNNIKLSNRFQGLEIAEGDKENNAVEEADNSPPRYVFLGGDSMVGGVLDFALSKSSLIKNKNTKFSTVKRSGANVNKLRPYCVAGASENPTHMFIHVGTNELCTDKPAAQIAEEIVALGKEMRDMSITTIISGIAPRADDLDLNKKGEEVNAIVKGKCQDAGLEFMDNSNIDPVCNLSSGKLHFNNSGTRRFCRNMLSKMNSL